MAKRRRRSLLKGGSRKSTGTPAPSRESTSEVPEPTPAAEVEAAEVEAAVVPPEPAPPPAPAPPPEPVVPPEPADPPSFDMFEPGPTEEASTELYAPVEGAAEDVPASLDDGVGFGAMGNFDDAPPPTDEVPSAVLQDVSQPYTAPMNVPEPPPIPGILDRFTPAGAQQRTSTSKRQDQRPSYIDDTPPPAPQLVRRDTPPPKVRTQRDSGSGGSPIPLVLGLGAIVVGALALGMFGLFAIGVGGTVATSGTDEGSPSELEGRSGIKVKVQDGLRSGTEGEDPEPVPAPAEPDPVEPAPTPDPAPAPEPEPSAPQPQVDPRPRPTPRPAPAPAPVEEAAAGRGTLRIRSNRKVLIYVDGKAVGYTPKSYKAEPGSRTVSAMLPGQPQSKQTQTLTLKPGATQSVEFTF